MFLPLARSTITACRFTVESTVPRPAPNMNNAPIKAGIDDTVASKGNAAQISKVPPVATLRHPKRVARYSSYRHRQYRAHTEAQQQQTQGAFVQPGPRLGIGHQRRPRGDAEPGDEKGDARGHLFQAPWHE